MSSAILECWHWFADLGIYRLWNWSCGIQSYSSVNDILTCASGMREWSTITINNHPSNPQQPIHSLRLAPVRKSWGWQLRRLCWKSHGAGPEVPEVGNAKMDGVYRVKSYDKMNDCHGVLPWLRKPPCHTCSSPKKIWNIASLIWPILILCTDMGLEYISIRRTWGDVALCSNRTVDIA